MHSLQILNLCVNQQLKSFQKKKLVHARFSGVCMNNLFFRIWDCLRMKSIRLPNALREMDSIFPVDSDFQRRM